MNKDELLDPTLLEDAKAAGFEINPQGGIHVGGNVYIDDRLAKFDQLRQARSTIDAELVKALEDATESLWNWGCTRAAEKAEKALAKHKGKD